MDVIPFFRFVASIFLGGLTFFFFALFIDELLVEIPTSGVYFNALMALFTGIPAIVLFRSGIKLVMHMQKKRFP